MATEEKTAGQGTLATVVATAALTLAIGVTAAALGGYLTPARDRAPAPVVQPAEPVAADLPPAAQNAAPVAPRVVLVPIAPDQPAAPAVVPAAQEPELLFAAYDPAEAGEYGDDDDDDDDDHRDRKHHEDDDEEDDDHDDD